MGTTLRRVRHLNRYREILRLLVKYGFGDIVTRIGLRERLPLFRAPSRAAEMEFSTPERIRLMLEELGPTFIKLGQLLSTRPDILPPEYIAEMEKLLDDVPAAPWEQIRVRIEDELGQPLEAVFASVEHEPLGSASLAQVHGARLLGGGDVVIKVQRPGIERSIEVDLEILYDLANLLQTRTAIGEITDLPEIAEDFAETLHTEMDYRREASNAERFKRNFAGETFIYIPDIYWPCVTHRVMVMERIYGIKIDDMPALVAAGYDPCRVAENATGMIVKEILIDGFFHADPHPGNLIVMEGEIIGAMDFGMVGWLEPHQRFELVQIYIAAINIDGDAMATHLIRLGATEQVIDHALLRRDAVRLLRKYQGQSLQQINVQEVIEDVMSLAFKHHLRLPSDLWLLAKALSIMEGVGLKLAPDFDIFAASEQYVAQLQREMFSPASWGPTLLKLIAQWADLFAAVPESSRGVLHRLEKGELQLLIEPRGMEPIMDRLERIVDRVVLGLLVSAFIIGLAMLVPAVGVLTEGGEAALFILAFVGASFLGLWLLVSIIRKGR